MRTVYAASLSFPAPAEPIWTEVCSWVEQWYSRKSGAVPLPPEWRSGTNGTIAPLDRHTLESVTHAGGAGLDGVLREVHWRYPDQYDPSLIWASDVAVFEAAEEVLFTLTLRIASFDFELLPAKFQLGNPRVVRKLVARGDARIGRHVVADAAERVEAGAVPDLVDDLLDPHRRHPIVVLSPDPYTERYGADPRPIAESLAGSASVCALATKWATFALTDELGKQFSCFNGAMRIYWPRFTLQSEPFFHRLWLPDHIARAEQGDGLALELMKIVAAAGAFRFVEPEKIRAFRRRLEEARLESLRATKGNDYEELFSEWDKATKELANAQAKIEELTRENVTLRENFLTVVTAQSEAPSVDVADAPESERAEVSNVREAVEEAQRRTSLLEYLPDALRSAKESPYRHPEKALTALLAIDEVAKEWGTPGSREAAFEKRGFTYKDSISKTTANNWGDEYSYKYNGKYTSFVPHLTIGGKQPQNCLSIHMHWDEKRKMVVIGHVGRHKTNTTS